MQKYIIFIGVDISKKWIDVALLIDGKKDNLPHRRFDQTQTGYQAFLKWIKTYAKVSKMLVCMEHTGIYTLSFCYFLEAQKIAFTLEDPKQINRNSGIRRGKNDQADSKAIAEYAYRFEDKLNQSRQLPNPLLIKVQTLLSLRARLVKYKLGLSITSNELKTCVPLDLVENTVDFSEQITTRMSQQIKTIMKQIKQLIFSDKELKAQYDLLHSIIGIGEVIIPYLLVYTNGFSAFKSPRRFASYIGIVPFKDKSGTSLDLPAKVSSISNRRLKVLMSTATIVAIQHDPQIKAYYNRSLERGKKEGWIYNAIKNKMVHRIFAVMRRGTPYVKLQH